MLKEIENLLSRVDVTNRHTYFQLKYFIIGKEPTIQGRLRKCADELSSRKDNIVAISASIDEAKDDVEIINLDIERVKSEKTDDEFINRYNEIKIRKLNRKKESLKSAIKTLQKTLGECEKEAEFFLQSFKELEKIEPLKPFDDFESNAQLWNERYYQDLQLRLLMQKPLDLETVKTILSLDKEVPIRKELINILDQIQQQAVDNKTKKELDSSIESARLEGKKENECQIKYQV